MTITPWAWDARAATTDPNSDVLIKTWLSYAIVNPNLVRNSWAVATAVAKDGDPEYSVKLTKGGKLDAKVRIPLGTKPDPSGDGHLTVWDSGRGREHDFWQAKYDSTSRRIVSASAGVSFPLGSVNEQTTGWGGCAANTPLRRGLVTPAQIAAGKIGGTMQFCCPQIGTGSPRFPAIHNVPTGGDASHLVEGTWLAFPPDMDFTPYALPAWQLTIARGLQEFGMVLRDNGGSLGIYGRNDLNQLAGTKKWADVGLGGSYAMFAKNFPWASLRVLNPPPAA